MRTVALLLCLSFATQAVGLVASEADAHQDWCQGVRESRIPQGVVESDPAYSLETAFEYWSWFNDQGDRCSVDSLVDLTLEQETH